jgi:putative membrane protein
MLPLLPALIHVYIFVLESFLWGTKRTNKVFNLRPEEAASTRLMAFNQGFYNLFLALAIILGLGLRTEEATATIGTTLVIYGLVSIIGAGLVLVISERKLWKGALIQIIPALVAVIPLCSSVIAIHSP